MYYSFNAPATGGPALRTLPHQGNATPPNVAAPRARAPAYEPPAITPVIHPALAGEGVWRPTFMGSTSRPPVLVATFRPDPNYPEMVAGVAWIDGTETSTWLYPGRQEPAVAMASRGPMEVPLGRRTQLVATFNSAFKLSDSGGGFASGGHTYAPMRGGTATILRYRDGRIDIRAWTGGPSVGSDVVYARQNLPLIVNGGRPNPNLSDGPEWGATLGNAVRVWRSGVGVDAHGNSSTPPPPFRPSARSPRSCATRRRAGDGARHQHLLAELHHLPPGGRDRGGQSAAEHGPQPPALPDAR